MAGMSSSSGVARYGGLGGGKNLYIGGNVAKIGGSSGSKSGGVLSQYGTPLSGYSEGMTAPMTVPNQNIYQGADANAIRNLNTGYSNEDMLKMKTAATNVNAAGTQGMNTRIRELMAAQGLSGSGSETGALTNAMLGSNRNLASTMSGIDISNAQTDLSNQYQKAGMLGNLMGIGLQENQQAIGQDQFGKSLYSDLYKWGKQFDYQKGQDATSKNMYNQQLQMMLKMYGLGGSGGGMGGGGYVPNWAG